MHLKPKLKRVGNKVAHPTLANSRQGWILRISDEKGNYYDHNGKIGGYRDNAAHIPIYGNPNALKGTK